MTGREALAEALAIIKCWLHGHDMYTRQVVAPPDTDWRGKLPAHTYRRDGFNIFAPPCARCGAPNPDAYGRRFGIYHHRIRP